MEQLTGFLSYLFSILGNLGVWAYGVIFLIAFADSIIIIGTFTTASAFLLLAGVFVSLGIYDLGMMSLSAAIGAVLGGFLNYFVGRIKMRFIVHKAQKYEKKFQRGSYLIERYGGAALLFGRFFSPLSSVMTFAAGLGGMRPRTFIFWNILSGLVWAVTLVFIGNFFGTSLYWLDIWPIP